MRKWLGMCTLCLFAALCLVGGASAENPPTHSETGSVETAPITPIWFPGADDDPLIPQPPPFSLLHIEDPMPNPSEDNERGLFGGGRGNGVIHDSTTGETLEFPVESRTDRIPAFGGAYSGVLPIDGDEPLLDSFVNMYQIHTTQDSPWRMNVKLLMRFEDNVGVDHWYVCSGTMKDAEVVLTAGHCVFNRDTDIMDWAEEVWVYPGWDGVGSYSSRPVEPFGYGHSTSLGSWTGWTASGDWDSDYGLVRITRAVGMLTGWYGYAWGGDCPTHMGYTYRNASYPSQNCPDTGLHNGQDMYYWYGSVDSCPWNQLQLDTGGGNCFDTVWGGMSGSGMYRIFNSSRYVHAICSTSNRDTWGRYVRQTEAWVDWMYDPFIADSRGSTFDLQALDSNFEPTTITAGQPTTLSNFLATNPTNGTGAGTWYFNVYLSTNDYISSGDINLGSRFFNWTFPTMNSVRVNVVHPTIPYNTPSGTYWLGVILDSGTDGYSSNNDTTYWDATQITVNGVADLQADSIFAPSGVYASGEGFPTSYTATNIGGDASNSVTVEIRASTNPIISGGDALLGSYAHSSVAGGGMINGTPTVSFPAYLANGYYFIGMRVLVTGDADASNNTDYDIVQLRKFDGLFYDGFESGNLSGWGNSAP